MAKKAARKMAAKKAAARQSKPQARKAAARKPARAQRTTAAKASGPKWKPEGLHDLIGNLVFKDTTAAIEFYKTAFGAKELMRMMSPDGKAVWHAELRIGDSTLFMNDEMPGGPTVAPGPDHKPTLTLQVYVPDCDAVFNRAVQAGGRPGMPMADMFWGDRMGSVIDPFGQVWMISTRVRMMSDEEMRKAGEQFAAEMAKKQQPPHASEN